MKIDRTWHDEPALWTAISEALECADYRGREIVVDAEGDTGHGEPGRIHLVDRASGRRYALQLQEIV